MYHPAGVWVQGQEACQGISRFATFIEQLLAILRQMPSFAIYSQKYKFQRSEGTFLEVGIWGSVLQNHFPVKAPPEIGRKKIEEHHSHSTRQERGQGRLWMLNDSFATQDGCFQKKSTTRGGDGGILVGYSLYRAFPFAALFSILPLILFLNCEPWTQKEDSKNRNFSSIKFTFNKV